MKSNWREENENYRPKHENINELDRRAQTWMFSLRTLETQSKPSPNEFHWSCHLQMWSTKSNFRVHPARLVRFCQTVSGNLTQRSGSFSQTIGECEELKYTILFVTSQSTHCWSYFFFFRKYFSQLVKKAWGMLNRWELRRKKGLWWTNVKHNKNTYA